MIETLMALDVDGLVDRAAVREGLDEHMHQLAYGVPSPRKQRELQQGWDEL